MIRIWGRMISQSWHREFRRNGYTVLNSFSLHFQAHRKKYITKKMLKEIGESNPPEKPTPIINGVDDIPNIENIRIKLNKIIEKIEKQYGPLTFKLNEAKDGNQFNSTISTNAEGYRALWRELLDDTDNGPEIIQALQSALSLESEENLEILEILEKEEKEEKLEDISVNKAIKSNEVNDMKATIEPNKNIEEVKISEIIKKKPEIKDKEKLNKEEPTASIEKDLHKEDHKEKDKVKSEDEKDEDKFDSDKEINTSEDETPEFVDKEAIAKKREEEREEEEEIERNETIESLPADHRKLFDDFLNERAKIAVSNDLCRIDIGLIINRSPILIQ